jgi:uncharacterized protein YkwD
MSLNLSRIWAALAILIAVLFGGFAARHIIDGSASTYECRGIASGWTGHEHEQLRSTHPVTEAAVIRLINSYRAQHDLRALGVDPRLGHVARVHSRSMTRGAPFGHGDFVRRLAGWTPATCIAENLAKGTGGFARAPGIVSLWRSSPPHKHVLLLTWIRRVGVGIRIDPQGTFFVTADFSS